MAKTNFSKVETILEEGMLHINVKKLLELADIAAGIGTPKTMDFTGLMIALLRADLIWFFKLDHALYRKFEVDREKTKALVAPNKTSRTKEEMEEIKKIKEKMDAYKEKFNEELPEDYNDGLVEIAREESVNARFNVRQHWLPLQ